MNTQLLAAVAGGLVIGGAAFIPMEVAALQSPAASPGTSQGQDQQNEDASSVSGESIDDSAVDGTAGVANTSGGTAPAPIAGPTFGSGDDDDDDDDDDEDDDDHEDREDHDDDEDDDDD